MPSLNLLSRLYRKRATSSAIDVSSDEARATPEPRASLSENALPRTSLSSPFERRIHPNLNALAEELSPSNETVPLSRPSHSSETNASFVSLTPWTRNRQNFSTTNTNPAQETRLENLPESRTSEDNVPPTSERSESRTNRIFNRLTGLGANPPSSWNTFGRRRSGRHNSVPHISDFGASPDISLSNSQRSHTSSNHTSPRHLADTSGDTYGTQSNHSSQSFSNYHSRSQSQAHSFHTPSHTQHPQGHSPPSSGFTFGSIGPVYPSPPSLPATYPALRLSLFGAMSGVVAAQNVSVGEFEDLRSDHDTNIESLSLSSSQPRPSTSMPSLNQHKPGSSQISNITSRTRPRVQDIFPAAVSSSDQQTSRSRRRDRSGSTGTSPRRRQRQINSPSTSAELSFVSGSVLPKTRVDNVEMSEVLGTPFRLQKGPVLEPSAIDESPNLSTNVNANNPTPSPHLSPQNGSMVAGIIISPSRSSSSSPGESGDERRSNSRKSSIRGKPRGKTREREASGSVPSSRPSSPLRNVTPSTSTGTVLAEFTAPVSVLVPPLPTSISTSTSTSTSNSTPGFRPSTPRRSAIAVTSRSGATSTLIPLATSSSGSSLGKGKRKADDVDGTGEIDAGTGTETSAPDVKRQQRAAHRATFAAEPRTHRNSTSSYTASHHARRKRARLSSGTSQAISEHGVRGPSRTDSLRNSVAPNHPSASNLPSSRGSRTPTQSSLRAGSASSHQHHGGGSVRYATSANQQQRTRGRSSSTRGSGADTRRGSMRSVSQTSIPISALVSPHAPSISLSHSRPYHMRDPRKPTPVHPTSWSLAFPSAGPEERGFLSGWMDTITCSGSGWGVGRLLERGFKRKGSVKGKEKEGERDLEKQVEIDDGGKRPVVDWIEGGGSPIHAWLFFFGFVFFPAWWIAGFLVGTPKTRRLGGDEPGALGAAEKSVVLDDPQVEHDAKSWRTRCRVLAAISLLTYVPFIVLIIIFVPRS